MTITSSPWGFRFHAFDRYARYLKSIGITDLCLMFGAPEKFPLAVRPTKEAAEECRKHADDLGVNLIEIATTMDYQTELPLAVGLGVKYFRVCDIWEDTEENFQKIVKMLRDMGAQAQKPGLMVIVENHGGLMAKAAACRRLMETVGMPNVRLNYDPANFEYYGEDPVEALDEIKPFIGFIHCKNVRYEIGKPRYCRIAEGVIDYSRIFKALPMGDAFPVCLEYEDSADAEKGTLDDLNSMRMCLGTGGEQA
ncbi:MAG: sugar phosphate isomerase/epimerase [Verrucomicrobiae bacterium]|nr:sugar phosphate isomerase/epimerase [Verrucomicrobiae bacterium]